MRNRGTAHPRPSAQFGMRCVMKKFLLASAGVLAIGVVSASAADLPRQRPMPEKASVYVTPPYNWTGFYVGINGGWGFGRSDISAPVSSGSYDTSGGLVGGTLGYNYQMGQVVFGLEGDIDWSDLHGSAPCAGTTCETRNNWLSTARGAQPVVAGFAGGAGAGRAAVEIAPVDVAFQAEYDLAHLIIVAERAADQAARRVIAARRNGRGDI